MLNQPLDNFEQFYTEKLWEMIPAIYRHEDGLAQNPGVLRALVEIVAKQAAVLRRSQDRLWEDQHIEWCQDWAVPYIGDLVATRLVSALNLRGRRVDVAKTIYYRRRKGTLRVIEELASDIAGWEGKAVEEFKRLGRMRHALDPKPAYYAGKLSGTLPGGWADIRNPLAAHFADTAWDEFFYTPDVRRHRGFSGRRNIPKLALHLFRVPALQVFGVQPFMRPDQMTFTFDPSGRDTALFIPRQRQQDLSQNWDDWQSAQPWELPQPMTCRVLGQAEYQIENSLIAQLETNFGLLSAEAADLRTVVGQRFLHEARLVQTLASMPTGAALTAPAILEPLLDGALVQDCGKMRLYPDAVQVDEIPNTPVPRVQTRAANLKTWAFNPANTRLLIDPDLGRMKFLGSVPDAQTLRVSYYYGFPAFIGAGAYDRQSSLVAPTVLVGTGGGAVTGNVFTDNDVVQIQDSCTYGPMGNPADFNQLTLQAADGERPYIRIQSDWVFEGKTQAATLILNGLWIGSQGIPNVVLDGDFEEVIIQNCTLDPGGQTVDGQFLSPVCLVIAGQVNKLSILSSILGPMFTQNNGLVEKLEIQDSIVQALNLGQAALDFKLGEADIQRTTILGPVSLHRLWASEVLATGLVTVEDTQNGCFRFSAAKTGSRLPKPYESVLLADTRALFTSTQFGHWGFAQLSQAAPTSVSQGAENGSELGAFSGSLNPIRFKSLQAKVDEYLPFGLIPIYPVEV